MKPERKATIIVPGEPDSLVGRHRPRTAWQNAVDLAPKWRYTLVKPGTWRGLLRGRLPQAGRAAARVAELLQWNSNRWPGSNLVVVIPTGRRRFWSSVAEQAAALSHLAIETPAWAPTAKNWVDWAKTLKIGDLIVIDDTVVSGQRLIKLIENKAPAGVQLGKASVLLPELRLNLPVKKRLVVAEPALTEELLALGFEAPDLLMTGRYDRLERLRRELASRQPNSILIMQPALTDADVTTRFTLDDELTQMTSLLDQYGYGVRVVGAPDRLMTRQSWPIIDWSAGKQRALPSGWQSHQARLLDAKRFIHQHLI